MYLITVNVSVASSIVNQRKKLSHVKSFVDFDILMTRKFGLHMDYSSLNNNIVNRFTVLVLTLLVPSLLLFAGYSSFSPDYLDYGFTILTFNHFVQVGMFQVFIFTLGIQNRVELLFRGLKIFKSTKNAKSLVELQKCFIKLSDINRKQNQWIQLSLLISLLQTFLCITDNLFWLVVGLTRNDNRVLIGAYLFFAVFLSKIYSQCSNDYLIF